MTEQVRSRRSLLRNGAVGAGMIGVSALGAGLVPEAAQAATVGPWNYVAPGESIQAAVTGGSRAIQLGDGTYSITGPIIATSGLTIRGIGQRTRIVATAAMAEMVAIGNGGAVEAVNLSDLVLDCDNLAQIGVDLNIIGTTGFYQGEPDSVCRLDNLWVFDPVLDGVVYRGSDTQACQTSRVRVRRAGRYGFRVEAPDNWFSGCEATNTTQTGNSAGFYVGTAISGSNGIGAGNNYFIACKAWYCHDYGWLISGQRNIFVGCEAQDIRSHGFYIASDKNTFHACLADTCGMLDVGGAVNTADGFYAEYACVETPLIGCQATDRQPNGEAKTMRYGFNVPTAMSTAGMLVAPTGWNTLGATVNLR